MKNNAGIYGLYVMSHILEELPETWFQRFTDPA